MGHTWPQAHPPPSSWVRQHPGPPDSKHDFYSVGGQWSHSSFLPSKLSPGLQPSSRLPFGTMGLWILLASFPGSHPLQGAGLSPIPVLLCQEGRCPSPCHRRHPVSPPAPRDPSSQWGLSPQLLPLTKCKRGASCLGRLLTVPPVAVSPLCWPQILEDSSRGLQGAGGSRSARSSCSRAWLRRYMSI